MATKSFHDKVVIKDDKAMERLESAQEKGCSFSHVKPISSDERERQKRAAKEWMLRR